MLLPKELNNQFDDLATYVEKINKLNSGSATALIVIHKDKIVTEHYSGDHSQLLGARNVQADSEFCIASVRKSYIGFATALAIFEGKITSIDSLASKYISNPVQNGITIRHLLTHTHGLSSDEHGNIYGAFNPGSNWHYNNRGIDLLEQVIYSATGMTVEQIVQEKVSVPLGLIETGWRTKANERLVQVVNDPLRQPESMLGSLFVSARELAYWGYLHLKKGVINGQKLVPEQVIEMITSLQSPVLEDKDLPSNGFLWQVKQGKANYSEIGDKVPTSSFQIIGITGPILLVIPEYDLVVVRMYNKMFNYGGPNGQNYLEYIREFGDKVMECLHKTNNQNEETPLC